MCPYVRNAGRGQLSSEWRHNENDVTMIIAGLVADGTGRKYGDWRHVATGCNALVYMVICNLRFSCFFVWMRLTKWNRKLIL